jgi:hypothetical protein
MLDLHTQGIHQKAVIRKAHSIFTQCLLKVSNLFKTQADVEIVDLSLDDELLCLLISLRFYLLILQVNDTAVAAVTGAS